MLQRAVEEEVTAFLGRARYERTPEARGWRNGIQLLEHRLTQRTQAGEGARELRLEP